MALSNTQLQVLKGMLGGAFTAALIVSVGSFWNPANIGDSVSLDLRIKIIVLSFLPPGLSLVVFVGRLAKHRFFHEADINGSGLTRGTEEAKVLQAVIQNTLEQLVVALIAYTAWGVSMPANTLSVIPIAGVAFIVGRFLFAAGYKKGAPARALGFTLCFYTTLAMLLVVTFFSLFKLMV